MTETIYSPQPSVTCDLPDLPYGVLPNVGFPTPTDIMVSRTDYGEMINFIDALRDWVAAASACLAARDQ